MSDTDRSHQLHRLYTERNQSVQLAAALAYQLGIPVGVAPGRSIGWQIVAIDFPAGQVSWAISPNDYVEAFAPYPGEIHDLSTWEKASRLHRTIMELVEVSHDRE